MLILALQCLKSSLQIKILTTLEVVDTSEDIYWGADHDVNDGIVEATEVIEIV